MALIPVVLDPAMLAFTPDISHDDFVERVRFLAQWAKFARSDEVQIQIPPEVRTYLIDHNYFPAYSTVAQAIDTLGLRYRYAPEDVIGPVITIFNRLSCDLYCCVRDAMHQDFASTPPQPWYSDGAINNEVQRSLVLAAIEGSLHQHERALFASVLRTHRIGFSAVLVMVDPDYLAGFRQVELPKAVSKGIAVVADLEAVWDALGSHQMWAAAAGNTDIKTAIKLRCREILRQEGGDGAMRDIPEFYVGSDFYPSLQGRQAAGDGRFASVTLQACADAVLERPTFEWREFNKSRRKSDGAEPLRGHLTGGNMALRLMAWRRAAEGHACLEFANVGEKWEEEIVYSDPSAAV